MFYWQERRYSLRNFINSGLKIQHSWQCPSVLREMHRVTLRLTAFALALWSMLSWAQSTGAAPRGTLLAMGLCCHLHLSVSELPGNWYNTGMVHPLRAHPGLWAACGHRSPATAWDSCIRWVPKSFFKKKPQHYRNWNKDSLLNQTRSQACVSHSIRWRSV